MTPDTLDLNSMPALARHWAETPECPTCRGCGYELDSTGEAVPCGSCAGQDEPDDWQPSAETVAGVEAGKWPF